MNLKPSDLAISGKTEIASNTGLIAQMLEGPVPDVCLRPIRPGNTPSDFLLRGDTALPTHCRELAEVAGAAMTALGCGNLGHVV